MENKKEDIGSFFKSRLDVIQIGPERSSWARMEKRLARMQFLRFDAFTFNVYYASIILFTFCFSSATFFKTSYVPALQKEELPASPALSSEPLIENTNQKDEADKQQQHEPPSLYKRNLFPSTFQTIKTDSVKGNVTQAKEVVKDVLSEHIDSSKHKIAETQEEKGTIFITKQDTIYIVDTLDKSGRKLKNRKRK